MRQSSGVAKSEFMHPVLIDYSLQSHLVYRANGIIPFSLLQINSQLLAEQIQTDSQNSSFSGVAVSPPPLARYDIHLQLPLPPSHLALLGE